MAKAKLEITKSTLNMTWDELFIKGKDMLDCYDMQIYGKPTREFSIGQEVKLGNLSNVRVVHHYGDGIYAIEHDKIINRNDKIRSNDDGSTIRIRTNVKWIEIIAIKEVGITKFTDNPYRRPNYLSSALDSMIHMHRHNGFTLDTRFQRGYVWTNDDRESLLDSIFNQGSIGSFILSRHNGYAFKDSEEKSEFRTLSGETISIPKSMNHTVSIIDGQQRLTTLINYYLGRWAYKGYYFNELSGKDKSAFINQPISYALVDESNGFNLKDWVWMFLQANKGVSQSREHLSNMEEYFKGL